MSHEKTRRQKRRATDSPMPMGGAGLIRFYQDQSNGIKISPIATIIIAVLLIVVVVLAHNKVFDWLV